MKEKTTSRTSCMRVKKSLKYQAVLALVFVALFACLEKAEASCRDGAMIHEIYGGGGNNGAQYKNDFIVLYNSSSEDISMDGWMIQYASTSGSFSSSNSTKLVGTLSARSFYLIRQAAGNGNGVELPESDAFGTVGLSASSGKVALVKSEVVVNSQDEKDYIDFVKYSGASNTKSVHRKNAACPDSDDYENDFEAHAPDPRNSSFEQIEENICQSGISINEIYPFSNEEYVEVVSEEEESCFLTGWKISDKAGHEEKFSDDAEISEGSFLVLVGNLHLNNDEDEIHLLNAKDKEIDKQEYKTNFSTQDKSYSFFEDGWRWTKTLTPSAENEENYEEEKDDSLRSGEFSKHFGTVFINEILPDPEKGTDEFIEIYNSGDTESDLSGWKLHDATKKGEYEFENHLMIGAKKFLTVFGEVFKFALNSSKETLTLRDEEGKIVSEIYYDKSKKGASYNFNGSSWKWSKFLTPGKENIFNSEPYGKIKIPDEVYEKVYADFSVGTGDADGDIVKVTWDFGDKHKSYLAKTRHKYVKKGTYDGSVKLSDGSEDVVHNFTVKVEEFPHPKVKITIVNANPEGSDTKNETITIQNKSKKKINLKGWSIATGWKNFVNHPIREDVEINKNKSKELTREVSSFTLNNKKDKIELRYPDGEVAYKLKYKKEEGIEEGEVYKKVEGGWEWAREISNDKLQITSNKQNPINNSQNNDETSGISDQDTISNIKNAEISEQLLDVEIEEASSVISNQLSIKTEKENKLLAMTNEEIEIELLKFDENFPENAFVKEVDGKYLLVPESPEQEHYAVVFLSELSTKTNIGLNALLNYFEK